MRPCDHQNVKLGEETHSRHIAEVWPMYAALCRAVAFPAVVQQLTCDPGPQSLFASAYCRQGEGFALLSLQYIPL